jgi:Flp pilus assembly protein TadG
MGSRRERSKRRGATLALAAFLFAVLAGMLAFGIDVGYATASRSELQRTADSAALAGGWQLLDGIVARQTLSGVQTAVGNTASTYAGNNPLGGRATQLAVSGEQRDVTVGKFDWNSSTWSGSVSNLADANAVRVRIRRNASMNGRVPLFFGPIFGREAIDMEIDAVAAMTSRIGGFDLTNTGSQNIMLLPFALDKQTWDAMMAGSASDNYSFSNNQVRSGKDQILEVNLYPQGTGSPGNRGTVDIGGQNNSTADIARQIVQGISAADFQALKASGRSLTFNSQGALYLQGDTGISAGIKDELASIIGKVRCIPIFEGVPPGNGNNAEYKIVGFEGVRILFVRLTGPMNQKQVIVQPAPMVTRGVVPSSTARVSSFVYSPVVLVQ